MITPDEIAVKANRAYLPFVRAWLRGESFTPLDLPVGGLPPDYRALQRAVDVLLQGAQAQRGAGYTVELQVRTTRAFGQQSLPQRIHIASADDLLFLAGKREEFAALMDDVALIRATLPELEAWLVANPQHVIEHHGLWPDLLRVGTYFRANPRPERYLRELPIAVHTKFIEQHTGIIARLLDVLLPETEIDITKRQFEQRYGLRYDVPLVRLRLLDPSLGERLGLPLTDLAAPVTDLAALPCAGLDTIIVENKMVFLTLPPRPATLAIFGSGFQVELLHQLPWLAHCRIWYWGDLDAQGFQLLARLRALFPQAASLMMDAATLETFRTFAVAGTPSSMADLPQLTPDEQAVYANLVQTNLRLEQERISHAYAARHLEAIPCT